MQWYYALGGQQFGPMSLDELQKLASSGVVQSDTLVWKSGMPNWIPASQVPDITLPISKTLNPALPPVSSPYAPPSSSLNRTGNYSGNGSDINGTAPLILGIVATMFCCIPTGIVAIIYAAQVSSKVARNDFEGARNNIRTSYIWSGVSLVLGLIFTVGYFALVFAGAVAG